MKRHPVLHKLTEDHHHGLVQARHLRSATPETIVGRTRAFLSAWRREIAPHFQEEELALLPFVCPPLPADHDAVVTVLTQHVRLRRWVIDLQNAHAQEDPAACLKTAHELASLLDEHIRFEEAELFQAIQDALDPAQLAALGAHLSAYETASGACRID